MKAFGAGHFFLGSFKITKSIYLIVIGPIIYFLLGELWCLCFLRHWFISSELSNLCVLSCLYFLCYLFDACRNCSDIPCFIPHVGNLYLFVSLEQVCQNYWQTSWFYWFFSFVFMFFISLISALYSFFPSAYFGFILFFFWVLDVGA